MGSVEVVKKLGLKKEDGYFYFVNKNGDVCRVKIIREGDDYL